MMSSHDNAVRKKTQHPVLALSSSSSADGLYPVEPMKMYKTIKNDLLKNGITFRPIYITHYNTHADNYIRTPCTTLVLYQQRFFRYWKAFSIFLKNVYTFIGINQNEKWFVNINLTFSPVSSLLLVFQASPVDVAMTASKCRITLIPLTKNGWTTSNGSLHALIVISRKSGG